MLASGHFTHFTSHFTAIKTLRLKRLRHGSEVSEMTFPFSTRAGGDVRACNPAVWREVWPKSLHSLHQLPPRVGTSTGSPSEVSGEVSGVGEVTLAREAS